MVITLNSMVRREAYIGKLKPFIGKPLIKIITGIRRSGKPTVLKLLTEEVIKTGVKTSEILYFNFESFANSHLTSAKRQHIK